MIVPVMAISNLVLTRQIYSEETNGARAHYREPVPLKRMPLLADYHVIDFRQIHWLRGKISLTCCREQKAAFLSVALTLWFCCLYERWTIILVEMFSDMCYLKDNVPRNCQTNTVARSV